MNNKSHCHKHNETMSLYIEIVTSNMVGTCRWGMSLGEGGSKRVSSTRHLINRVLTVKI